MKTIVNTELYAAMISCGRYTHEEAVDTIQSMRDEVENGEDPDELLHEEGFEPDYVFDILNL